jgi:hypothetical protein
MMTIGGSWGTTLLVGSAMLLILSLTFMFLTRSLGSSSLSVRCPMTGHLIAVPHIADESSYVTDAMRGSAYTRVSRSAGDRAVAGSGSCSTRATARAPQRGPRAGGS